MCFITIDAAVTSEEKRPVVFVGTTLVDGGVSLRRVIMQQNNFPAVFNSVVQFLAVVLKGAV